MPQTREHILLCKRLGIKSILVYLNKADIVKDQDVFDLAEMELKDYLIRHGFDKKGIYFVRGSALCSLNGTNPELGDESISKLIEVIDAKLERNILFPDEDFLMKIEKCFNIPV